MVKTDFKKRKTDSEDRQQMDVNIDNIDKY